MDESKKMMDVCTENKDESIKIARMSAQRILKNVIMLSLVFFMIFLSFGGLVALQVRQLCILKMKYNYYIVRLAGVPRVARVNKVRKLCNLIPPRHSIYLLLSVNAIASVAPGILSACSH